MVYLTKLIWPLMSFCFCKLTKDSSFLCYIKQCLLYYIYFCNTLIWGEIHWILIELMWLKFIHLLVGRSGICPILLLCGMWGCARIAHRWRHTFNMDTKKSAGFIMWHRYTVVGEIRCRCMCWRKVNLHTTGGAFVYWNSHQ